MAVDYVLLGKNGERICPAVAYRDSRTETVPDELEKTVPFAWLYGRTGIQMQKFNTVYQLAAQKKEMPDVFEKAEKLLMIPDYLAYRLSGVAVNEYTNASTTAMVSAEHKTWDKEIIARVGLPEKIFGELHKPGEALGGLTERVKEKVGFDLTVRLAASHDTASAFLAVRRRMRMRCSFRAARGAHWRGAESAGDERREPCAEFYERGRV